jgi:hypothetical protein
MPMVAYMSSIWGRIVLSSAQILQDSSELSAGLLFGHFAAFPTGFENFPFFLFFSRFFRLPFFLLPFFPVPFFLSAVFTACRFS